MSQSDVLELLYELGGSATTKEIRDLAKRKYPERTLYIYVGNRLKKLEKWETIKREIKDGKLFWKAKPKESI